MKMCLFVFLQERSSAPAAEGEGDSEGGGGGDGAKEEKKEKEKEKERDVYDMMLTQAEIQEGVDDVNTMVKKQEAEERRKRRCKL